MDRKQELLQHLTGSGSLTVDPVPGIPLVEISGDHRILLEGHRGVLEYSRERILVDTKMGTFCICGNNLTMMKMTKEQLIIRGCIQNLSIHRRS